MCVLLVGHQMDNCTSMNSSQRDDTIYKVIEVTGKSYQLHALLKYMDGDAPYEIETVDMNYLNISHVWADWIGSFFTHNVPNYTITLDSLSHKQVKAISRMFPDLCFSPKEAYVTL